jgi:hypothetical protein
MPDALEERIRELCAKAVADGDEATLQGELTILHGTADLVKRARQRVVGFYFEIGLLKIT